MKEGFEPKSFKNYIILCWQNKLNWTNSSKKTSTKDGNFDPDRITGILMIGWLKTHPLPLISEVMDKLKGTKYFSKLDICWGYNNIWIQKGDKWKATSKTNKGLLSQQ
jgi:hypothetical protein